LEILPIRPVVIEVAEKAFPREFFQGFVLKTWGRLLFILILNKSEMDPNSKAF